MGVAVHPREGRRRREAICRHTDRAGVFRREATRLGGDRGSEGEGRRRVPRRERLVVAPLAGPAHPLEIAGVVGTDAWTSPPDDPLDRPRHDAGHPDRLEGAKPDGRHLGLVGEPSPEPEPGAQQEHAG